MKDTIQYDDLLARYNKRVLESLHLKVQLYCASRSGHGTLFIIFEAIFDAFKNELPNRFYLLKNDLVIEEILCTSYVSPGCWPSPVICQYAHLRGYWDRMMPLICLDNEEREAAEELYQKHFKNLAVLSAPPIEVAIPCVM